MSKRRKNASAGGRDQGPGEGSATEAEGAGGTSTDQPTSQKSTPTESPDADILTPRAIEQEVLATIDATATTTDRPRINITPRNANAQEREALAATAPKKPSATTPSVALKTPEQQLAFAEAILEHEGLCPAADAWGLKACSVFYHASVHPEFRKMLNAAQGAVFENQVYKLDDMCNHLLDMEPKAMNQCANAYRTVFDYRMRIVGKLLPVIYGDRLGSTVNIQNNTGIVCDEQTRERLIAMNTKLLSGGKAESHRSDLPQPLTLED